MVGNWLLDTARINKTWPIETSEPTGRSNSVIGFSTLTSWTRTFTIYYQNQMLISGFQCTLHNAFDDPLVKMSKVSIIRAFWMDNYRARNMWISFWRLPALSSIGDRTRFSYYAATARDDCGRYRRALTNSQLTPICTTTGHDQYPRIQLGWILRRVRKVLKGEFFEGW